MLREASDEATLQNCQSVLLEQAVHIFRYLRKHAVERATKRPPAFAVPRFIEARHSMLNLGEVVHACCASHPHAATAYDALGSSSGRIVNEAKAALQHPSLLAPQVREQGVVQPIEIRPRHG